MRCNGTSLTSKLAILSLCGLLTSSPGLAEEPVYGALPQADHGYLLIRIFGADGERVERFEFTFEEFPGYANRYEIYLSMMGKKAISLREFLSIVEEHSE